VTEIIRAVLVEGAGVSARAAGLRSTRLARRVEESFRAPLLKEPAALVLAAPEGPRVTDAWTLAQGYQANGVQLLALRSARNRLKPIVVH
jgi:hypothetical protein